MELRDTAQSPGAMHRAAPKWASALAPPGADGNRDSGHRQAFLQSAMKRGL